jgi:hypothetical protein
MVQRGRPTRACSMIRDMRASDVAKTRILAILFNLAGVLPVAEACRQTGGSRTLFRRQRLALLKSGLAVLEPRPHGRPRIQRPKHPPLVQRLRDKIARLEEDLAFARAREEILRALPYRSWPKKKRAANPSD